MLRKKQNEEKFVFWFEDPYEGNFHVWFLGNKEVKFLYMNRLWKIRESAAENGKNGKNGRELSKTWQICK